MAWRTTPKLVLGVMAAGQDYDTVACPSLTPYITAANLITNRVATCAAAKSYAHTAEELVAIETWLAAWYYTKSDNKYSSKSTSKASGSFVTDPKVPEHYKDGALSLDGSDCLRGILSGAVARFKWLGKRASAQRPYTERD
jgi:hypothetical protein